MDATDGRDGWTRRMDAADGRDGWTRRMDATDGRDVRRKAGRYRTNFVPLILTLFDNINNYI